MEGGEGSNLLGKVKGAVGHIRGRKERTRKAIAKQEREAQQKKLAVAKVRDIAQRYGLTEQTKHHLKGSYSISNKLHGQRWDEVVVGEEGGVAIKEYTDIVMRVGDEEGRRAFEELVRDENITDLYTDGQIRLEGRLKAPYPYWFIVNAPNEDGSVVGKVRVVMDARLRDRGFFDEVVYPSFVEQRRLEGPLLELLTRKGTGNIEEEKKLKDQLLGIEEARGFTRIDPVEGIPTTRIRLNEGRKQQFFASQQAKPKI